VNFGLLLAWIGHSIESFALRTVATLLPSVHCETHSRARDLQPPKPWCLTAGFDLGGGQLRNQTVVDRAANRRRRRSLTSQDVSDRHTGPQGEQFS
jgi:hypothetical protein